MWRRLLYAAAAAAIAFSVYTLFGSNGMEKVRSQKKEEERLRDEVRRLGDENEELSQQVSEMLTDPMYQERIARDELGLIRPGEKVFRLER